ncbi:Calmodulin-binding transcription activator 4 [Hordeum vulgare]|nr:Calmodulin-binding transcription activator 4 [Hordeum vulgare]
MPPHSAGKLTLCITIGNMKVCSEYKDFEFRAKSTASSFTDLVQSSRSMKSTEELSLLAKFARILLCDNRSCAVSGDDPQPVRSPKLQMNDQNWQQLIDELDIGIVSFQSLRTFFSLN